MVHVKPSGQDRTDIHLALDAQRKLFTEPELTAFMIVSGDGAFGVLARQIQASEKRVIICGVGRTISRELIPLADPLIPLEKLLGLISPDKEPLDPVTKNTMQQTWVPFIVTLDRAERTLGFVGFKHFRDKWVMAGFGTHTPEERQELINEAIIQQIVEAYQVTNPKNSNFSTTAIRLNRAHPLVIAALGTNLEIQPKNSARTKKQAKLS
jgi:hypothetical protein